MPIRMSGLSSGLDTEALVSALVSSYSLKKDNLVKAQTKLSWKQDKWKTMNKSIYSFYSGKLSAARMSSYYSLKSAKVSNSSVATVTAASGAVSGTQSLKVNKLASTGYLTGGQVTSTGQDGKTAELSGSTKLSTLSNGSGAAAKAFAGGSISVSVNGKNTTIELTDDMTIDQFTSKLKEAGVNASFDANNQRFFISAKESGASNDFSLTANDANGTTSLQSMGLFTLDKATTDEYAKWAGYSDEEIAAIKDKAYVVSDNITSKANAYVKSYNDAKKAIDALEEKYKDNGGAAGVEAQVSSKQSEFDSAYDKYKTVTTRDDGTTVTTYDTDKMKEDGVLEDYKKADSELKQLKKDLESYQKNQQVMDDTKKYVLLDDDGTAKSADTDKTSQQYNNIKAIAEDERKTSDDAIDAKVAYAKTMNSAITDGSISSSSVSSGAVRIVGSDSEIELNGAIFTGNTNNFSINGLTIQATGLTAENETVSITTSTDVDGIYKAIKGMFSEYNTLIKSMDEAYNASSAKGYEPLTSAEKEAMSDDEVKEWEEKIKGALLRKDSTLGSVSTALKNDMMSSFEINGKSYSLSSFGIGTLGYFTSGDNEKGVIHIDGDSEDSSTSGNSDKLRAMIANDPETVVSFFSQLATKIYTDLGNKMASSSVSSAYTIYNDKEMATEYSSYTTKISDQEDKVSTWEDYYYKKFSAMESTLSTLNSQTSSLSSLFG